MESVGLWLTPLVLLPGVAILLISTSARYGEIHAEFHRLLGQRDIATEALDKCLIMRSTLFRNALVCLYTSVGLFSLASFLGGLVVYWAAVSFWAIVILTCLGILSLVFASLQLIRESLLSLEVIREHGQQIRKENEQLSL